MNAAVKCKNGMADSINAAARMHGIPPPNTLKNRLSGRAVDGIYPLVP